MNLLSITKLSSELDYYTDKLLSIWTKYKTINIYINHNVIQSEWDVESKLSDTIINTLKEAEKLGASVVWILDSKDEKPDNNISNYLRNINLENNIIFADKYGALSSIIILQQTIIKYKQYINNSKND